MPVPDRAADACAAVLADRGPEWLAAVARRHSRRAYDGRPVDTASLDALETICLRFAPCADARAILVRQPAVDVFTGAIGSYGKVVSAPHVLLLVGDTASPFADQHVGYVGEAVILEATALGLDTCWVGGFFSAKRVAKLAALREGERVLAVTPVGHARGEQSLTERAMRGMSRAARRREVAEIAPGGTQGWPEWAVAAVETARLAPSAMNRQPWRFSMDAGDLVVSRDSAVETPKVTKRLDCGIAMLHAHLGAIAEGAPGRWTDLDSGLAVARYRPDEESR